MSERLTAICNPQSQMRVNWVMATGIGELKPTSILNLRCWTLTLCAATRTRQAIASFVAWRAVGAVEDFTYGNVRCHRIKLKRIRFSSLKRYARNSRFSKIDTIEKSLNQFQLIIVRRE